MYGFSDQSNIIPLTRFSALRHGSSRYSGDMAPIIRTCVRSGREIVTVSAQTRHRSTDTLTAGGGWNLIPSQGGGLGADCWATLRPDRRWTTTTIRLVPRPR